MLPVDNFRVVRRRKSTEKQNAACPAQTYITILARLVPAKGPFYAPFSARHKNLLSPG